MAIDRYRADEAILSAREALWRYQARGGSYAEVSANGQAGSTLNSAFRFVGLNAWGEYYSDVVFDPFSSTGYFDQALSGAANPFANEESRGIGSEENGVDATSLSALVQGLMLDPLAVASR